MYIFDLENVNLQRKRDYEYRLLISRFYLEAGETVALIGPSGCGKSTALDILGMALEPSSIGKFLFCPQQEIIDVANLWKAQSTDKMAYLRSLYFGYVLQTGELLPFLNIEENIRLTASIKGVKDPNVESLMEELGISTLKNSMPKTLSIGERQRVAICRALASKPKVIFADEPTAALDPLMARKVMSLFLKTVREVQAALVVVTHDIKLAEEFELKNITLQLKAEGNTMTAILDRKPE